VADFGRALGAARFPENLRPRAPAWGIAVPRPSHRMNRPRHPDRRSPLRWLLTLGVATPALAIEPPEPAAREGEPAAGITLPREAPAASESPLDSASSEDGPWRLGEALGAPPWLTIEGRQRARFESLDEDFRSNRNGHNQLFAFRTLLKATVRQEEFELTGELQDSRQYGAPSKGQLGTSIVNAVELLQAYVALEFEDAFGAGDRFYVQAGRHTMDVGSRRLVARNRFRNTINAFTGVNALWEAASGAAVRAFFVLPVQRRPTGATNHLANHVAFDEERKQVKFYGAHVETPKTDGGLGGELYAFGLHENDGPDLATRDRELWTVGGRARKAPKKGFGFELESAIQLGRSRSSSSGTNTTDLDHRAQFHHVSASYGFDLPTDPRPRCSSTTRAGTTTRPTATTTASTRCSARGASSTDRPGSSVRSRARTSSPPAIASS